VTRADDILAQLNAAEKQYLLIGPGNVHYPSAALRMDGFASPEHWLLAFQLIAFARREEAFVRHVQLFGTNIPEHVKYTSTDVIRPVDGESLFDDNAFLVDLHDFRVFIGNTRVDCSYDRTDYERNGIDVDRTAAELAFVRMLVAEMPDAFFLTPEEILDHAGKRGLRHLFELHEWRHPDEGDDEMPSEMPCFRSIAQALAGCAELDSRSCTEESNTHWSHWVKYEHR
jgi:hypothetical protein